jgi:D-alanyl-D-alanine dipeptidase/carboxypeptidase
MRTLELNSGDTYKGYLILVNAAHPLAETEETPALAPVTGVDGILLEQQAAKMLSELLARLSIGEVRPAGGYRTMHAQRLLYADAVRSRGEDFARRYVAVPGCSEHQTGLAVDMAETAADDGDVIRPFFPYTGVCGQFRALAARYGFVERYPSAASTSRVSRTSRGISATWVPALGADGGARADAGGLRGLAAAV